MSTENYKVKHDLIQSGWSEGIIQNEISLEDLTEVQCQWNKKCQTS